MRGEPFTTRLFSWLCTSVAEAWWKRMSNGNTEHNAGTKRFQIDQLGDFSVHELKIYVNLAHLLFKSTLSFS